MKPGSIALLVVAALLGWFLLSPRVAHLSDCRNYARNGGLISAYNFVKAACPNPGPYGDNNSVLASCTACAVCWFNQFNHKCRRLRQVGSCDDWWPGACVRVDPIWQPSGRNVRWSQRIWSRKGKRQRPSHKLDMGLDIKGECIPS